MAAKIAYRINHPVSAQAFVALLARTTLGARRPLENRVCVENMLKHANLTVTAWQGERLVGIARCLTDFHYCCYVSDLAVDEACQHQGIGRALLDAVEAQLTPPAKIILLAAPQAVDYYQKIGFVAVDTGRVRAVQPV